MASKSWISLFILILAIFAINVQPNEAKKTSMSFILLWKHTNKHYTNNQTEGKKGKKDKKEKGGNGDKGDKGKGDKKDNDKDKKGKNKGKNRRVYKIETEVTVAQELKFDLSPLAGKVLTKELDIGTFKFSILANGLDGNECYEHDVYQNAMAIQNYENSTDVCAVMARFDGKIKPSYISDEVGDEMLTFEYSHYDPKYCGNDVRSLTLNFLCDRDAKEDVTSMDVFEGGCSNEVTISTKYACSKEKGKKDKKGAVGGKGDKKDKKGKDGKKKPGRKGKGRRDAADGVPGIVDDGFDEVGDDMTDFDDNMDGNLDDDNFDDDGFGDDMDGFEEEPDDMPEDMDDGIDDDMDYSADDFDDDGMNDEDPNAGDYEGNFDDDDMNTGNFDDDFNDEPEDDDFVDDNNNDMNFYDEEPNDVAPNAGDFDDEPDNDDFVGDFGDDGEWTPDENDGVFDNNYGGDKFYGNDGGKDYVGNNWMNLFAIFSFGWFLCGTSLLMWSCYYYRKRSSANVQWEKVDLVDDGLENEEENQQMIDVEN